MSLVDRIHHPAPLDGGDGAAGCAGNVAQWAGYTTGPYRNVPIETGDHYFVSSHYQEVVSVVGAQLLQLLDSVKGGGVMDGHSWLAEADDGGDGGDAPGAPHASDGGGGGADRTASAGLMTSLTQGAQHVSPGAAVGGFPEAAPAPAPGASASTASPPPSAGRFHAASAGSPGDGAGRSTPAPPPSAGRYHAAAAAVSASASASTSDAAATSAATNDAAASGGQVVLSYQAMLPPSGPSRSTAEAGAGAATAAPRGADDRRRRSSAGAPAGLGSPLPTLPARAISSIGRADTVRVDEDVPAPALEQSPDTVMAGAAMAEATSAAQAVGHPGTAAVNLPAEMAMRQPEAPPPNMAAAELRSWQQQLQQTRNIQLALTVLTLVPALLLAMFARG